MCLGFLGGVSLPEVAIVLVVALVIFGAKGMAEFARTLGRAMNELRRVSQDLRDRVMEDEPRLGAHARDVIDKDAATTTNAGSWRISSGPESRTDRNSAWYR
jgi:TatA/E family protein of Tat protein translocase